MNYNHPIEPKSGSTNVTGQKQPTHREAAHGQANASFGRSPLNSNQILQLQKSFGNKRVSQFIQDLTKRSADNAGPQVVIRSNEPSSDAGLSVAGLKPVQREVAVQIVPTDEMDVVDDDEEQTPSIDRVVIGGRAGSLWPQERHHTTPWQTYLDLIDRVLIGLDLNDDAKGGINNLDAHIQGLPGWELVDSLEEAKNEQITALIDTLATQKGLVDAVEVGSVHFVPRLQSYLKAWIEVRSNLPLAQGNVGGGAVNVAVSSAIAKLANTVTDENAPDQATIRGALLDLFDFDVFANTFTPVNDEEDDENYTDLGLDNASTEDDLDMIREKAFTQHALSVDMAYPTAFERAYHNIGAMVEAMKERWAAAGDDDDEYVEED